MKTKKTWTLTNARLLAADRLGGEIACLQPDACLPIDPFAIAKKEDPYLALVDEDFGSAFDGQLEYHPKASRFIAFVNSKYDSSTLEGRHSKTRFSLGHELGHYYIESHRAYLMQKGPSHPSESEYRSNAIVEREADAFSSGLLMPRPLVQPIIRKDELNFPLIAEWASDFQTSIISTTIRAVQLTDFPCAVAAIKSGELSWMFVSPSLVDRGCYPAERATRVTGRAAMEWGKFKSRGSSKIVVDGFVGPWFRTFDKSDELDDIYLSESYFPVPILDMLLVLLTLDESDLFKEDEDE